MPVHVFLRTTCYIVLTKALPIIIVLLLQIPLIVKRLSSKSKLSLFSRILISDTCMYRQVVAHNYCNGFLHAWVPKSLNLHPSVSTKHVKPT